MDAVYDCALHASSATSKNSEYLAVFADFFDDDRRGSGTFVLRFNMALNFVRNSHLDYDTLQATPCFRRRSISGPLSVFLRGKPKIVERLLRSFL